MLVPVKWLVALVSAILSVFSSSHKEAAPDGTVSHQRSAQHAELPAHAEPGVWFTAAVPAPPAHGVREFHTTRFLRLEQLPDGGVRVTPPPQLPL
jgi:hypothetical protein